MKFNNYSALFLIIFMGCVLLVYYLTSEDNNLKIPSSQIKCRVLGIITVREGGRLGNSIWEYASTVAIGQFLNLSPYMPLSILKELGEVFQNLSVPAYEDTILSDHCRALHWGTQSHCTTLRTELNIEYASPWDYLCNTLTKSDALDTKTALKPTAKLQKMYNDGLLSDVLVLPKWIAHTEGISRMGVQKFQDLFQIRNDVLDSVKKTIQGVLASTKDVKGEVSFVGVHVRRTDYNAYLKRKYGDNTPTVDSSYYKRAMEKMSALKPNNALLFLIVSDDRQWCMKELVNESSRVFWGGMEGSHFHNRTERSVPINARSHDLALLASVNDSIISYGTYGVTGALLAGGHTIAFNLTSDPSYQTPLSVALAKYLNNWELMS